LLSLLQELRRENSTRKCLRNPSCLKLQPLIILRASATASLIGVLPSSILSLALSNPDAATSLIEQAFATGTPAWFTSLPAEVQTYFETQVAAGPATATAAVPLTTGGSGSGNGTAQTTGKYTNGTTSSSGSTKTVSSAGSTGTGSGGAGSATSTGGAAVPTAIIGGGIAGLVGLLGMLAL
jgi:hypothetical protein